MDGKTTPIPHTMRAAAERMATEHRGLADASNVADLKGGRFPRLHEALTGGEHATVHEPSPTLMDRLHGIASVLADADETLLSARKHAWGGRAHPPLGDLQAEGRILQVLDMLEMRAASLRTSAHAVATELGA